jgi:enoyl-CoA hydratase/carnithine racemase
MNEAVATDLTTIVSNNVATVEFNRPPSNFFDERLIASLATEFERLDCVDDCRVIVLTSRGKVFCGGADVSVSPLKTIPGRHLYKEGLRLFRVGKPIVAAVQGAAIGGGLGLALVADFRVTCPEARFSANFNRMGFHPGFGLTFTLPRLVGGQRAALMFYTGRRYSGEDAVTMGLAELLVPYAEVRTAAHSLALEIAQSAPLAVVSTRQTLRRGMVDEVEQATEREFTEQRWHKETADFAEGVLAMRERRLPRFEGR